MLVALVVAGVSLVFSGVSAQPAQTSPQPPPLSAADLASRIQARYDTVKDFRSDFTQTGKGGFLRGGTEARGEVLVKKPDRMRWKYTSKPEREIVADGSQIYDYVRVDNIVSIEPQPQGDQASTALLFLAGRGNLSRDFTPSVPAVQPAGQWHLVLQPKRPQPDFTTLTLIVERQSLKLAGLIKADAQGETYTFQFPNLRENVGLTDKQFVFVPPVGVKVIR